MRNVLFSVALFTVYYKSLNFSIISGKPKKTHRFRRLFRKKTGILWVTRHTAAHAIFVERIDPI